MASSLRAESRLSRTPLGRRFFEGGYVPNALPYLLLVMSKDGREHLSHFIEEFGLLTSRRVRPRVMFSRRKVQLISHAVRVAKRRTIEDWPSESPVTEGSAMKVGDSPGVSERAHRIAEALAGLQEWYCAERPRLAAMVEKTRHTVAGLDRDSLLRAFEASLSSAQKQRTGRGILWLFGIFLQNSGISSCSLPGLRGSLRSCRRSSCGFWTV